MMLYLRRIRKNNVLKNLIHSKKDTYRREQCECKCNQRDENA
jgi:hypothetical protein